MSTESAQGIKVRAIAANLAAMHRLLLEAAQRSAEACESIRDNNCNAAIGTVIGLDATLEDAKALHVAALALHRSSIE